LKVVMDDGSEEEFGPGDTGVIPPGHMHGLSEVNL
jgi:mannose-6-phosphate isomerase-like protein (cupin superfamily)